MPARPASSGSAASSPPSSAPPTSTSFSSAPINPVVASSHSRRKAESSSWRRSDSQNQNAANSATADSPSSSATQDEDIRSKLSRPSSAGSQGSSSSRKSKHEDGGRPTPPTTSQSQSLPSLSSGSAALLQLRSNNSPPASSSGAPSKGSDAAGSKIPPQSAANAGTSSQNPMASFRRDARAREESNPLLPQDEDMDEDDEDVDEEGEEDPSAPPSPTDRDVRIMFHGREVFAEDLIGLRVAKTFAGQGRFLGQVVKFDKRVALYTVVYADGDAEDLTVDSTLQILIQDEIERADPAQPPPAISLLFKKGEDGESPASPDTGDFMMAPPQTQRQPNPTQRRARIQVSEREAQFVVSLFENHALPNLMQQGWRSSSGRGETRFMSPSGEVFPSALDVVGYIASDNELLTACFPANVHSAILSLLPPDAADTAAAPGSSSAFETGSNHGSAGSASRKRTTSDSPSTEQVDGKRTRQGRDGGYPLQMRGGAGRGASDTALYHPEDLDRRAEAASRVAAYRGQGMGSRIRMSGDRLVGGETTTEARIQGPPEVRGYRRTASRDPTLENPFASRWPGAESAEYARRFADSAGWRERGDAYVADRPLEAHPRNRIRGEGRYIHRMNGRTPAEGGAGAARGGSGTPTDYYRDSIGSPPGDQGSPVPSGLAYSQYSARARAGEYRSSELAARAGAAPRATRETASFMSPTDTLGASAAFSMMDVERISKSRPGSAHTDQLRGRSPRQADGEQYQSLQRHRRSGSGHSYHGQRGGDSHYDAEPTSEAQGEQHSAAASGTGSTPSQQQHE